jgi:hypothetical protein
MMVRFEVSMLFNSHNIFSFTIGQQNYILFGYFVLHKARRYFYGEQYLENDLSLVASNPCNL